jgi:hypothetical protein
VLTSVPSPDADNRVRLGAVARAATAFLTANASRASALDAMAVVALESALSDLGGALGDQRCELATALCFVRARIESLPIGRDRPRPGTLHVSSLADAGFDGRPLVFIVGLQEGGVFPSAGEVRHVEVPFAVRLSPADAARGLQTQGLAATGPGGELVPLSDVARGLQTPGPEFDRGRPAVLRGVIDLVYESGDGWRILDYKSDQLDGIVDVDAWLLAHYGPQLAQYRVAWERVSGARVASAELVALRARRTISVG